MTSPPRSILWPARATTALLSPLALALAVAVVLASSAGAAAAGTRSAGHERAALPDPADAGRVPRVVNDRCPVMTGDFASPLHEVQYRGSTVRFCCRECVDRFEADPLPFLNRIPHLPPEVVEAAIAETRPAPTWVRPAGLALVAALVAWAAVRLRAARHRHQTSPHVPTGGPHPTA